jgi:Mn-dependent DtxR family transcriptional regulator
VKTIERTIEKPVVDQRAIDRAVASAVMPYRKLVMRVQHQMQGVVQAVKLLPDRLEAVVVTLGEVEQMNGHHGADATTPTVRAPIAPPSTTPRPIRAAAADSAAGIAAGIARPQQRVLDAIAELNARGIERPTRSQLGRMLDVSPTTGSFKNNLSALRTAGYLDYPEDWKVALTEAGRGIAAESFSVRTNDDARSRWMATITNPEARMLEIILDAHPEAITREELADALGVSHTTGSFKNNVSALRTLGLIDYPSDGTVKATNLIVPEALV